MLSLASECDLAKEMEKGQNGIEDEELRLVFQGHIQEMIDTLDRIQELAEQEISRLRK